MSMRGKDKLVGSLLSLPTFNDEGYNLLLDRQKIHMNWIIENGIAEGNGVLLMAAVWARGRSSGTRSGRLLPRLRWRSRTAGRPRPWGWRS